jgi:acetyltransferase-like isoleucine patch superfamily enzyme
MSTVNALEAYADDRGNCIEYDGRLDSGITVEFTGSNNRLVVAPGARLGSLNVAFNCDNGYVEIAASQGVPALSATIRVGQDSKVLIGRNVSCTSRVGMSAVEGTTITIGDDVMFASDNQVRCDDGHPIFDVRTGKRVNVSRDITIENHVWLGWGATVLGGTVLGRGSVLGMGAIAKGRFPNNCVVAGVPARVVRRDIAWERPHLSLKKPFYKPDASTVTKSRYWDLTVDPHGARHLTSSARRFAFRVRRKLRRLVRRG